MPQRTPVHKFLLQFSPTQLLDELDVTHPRTIHFGCLELQEVIYYLYLSSSSQVPLNNYIMVNHIYEFRPMDEENNILVR